MLKALILENFKAFGGRRVIPIRPITLIFGPNSAGKSAILQSLLMLKQTISDPDTPEDAVRLTGSLVDLDSYRELIFRHEVNRECEVTPLFSHARVDWGNSLPVEWGLTALDDYTASWGLGVRIRKGVSRELPIPVEYPMYFGDSSEPFATFGPSQAAIEQAREILSASDPAYHDIQRAGNLMGTRIATVHSDHPFWIGAFRLFEEYSKPLLRDLLSEPQSILEKIAPYQPRLFADTPIDVSKIVEAVERLVGASVESFARILNSSAQVDFLSFRNFSAHPYPHIANDLVDLDRSQAIWARLFTYLLNVDPWNSFPGTGFLAMEMSSRLVTGLRDLTYLGPLREIPARHYIYKGTSPASVGHTGQWAPDALFSKPYLLDSVNSILQRFDVRYRLEVQRLRDEGQAESGVYLLRVLDRAGSVRASIRDVGFGISQVLPVIVQSLLADEGNTLLIEQPELHLHPRLQAELADVFIDAVCRGDDRPVGLILETHSEHLLLRLMRRIRETSRGTLPEEIPPLRPEDVSIIYVQPTENGSVPLVMDLDEDGELLTAWPNGFFEEGFRERFA